MDEIAEKLLEYRDPQTGEQVVKEVYQAHRVYSGPEIAIGPDMLIGYSRGYRVSWAATLARFDKQIVSDNTEAWNADHCIATDLVPGVIFANRPMPLEDPDLTDIAPTILTWFGIEVPPQMKGRSVFDVGAAMTSRN
jgi:predicted AlkP superfamily phosphohydrolase/phosphomutase